MAASDYSLRGHESMPQFRIPANPPRALQAARAGEISHAKLPDRSRYARVQRASSLQANVVSSLTSPSPFQPSVERVRGKRRSGFHAVRAGGTQRSIRARPRTGAAIGRSPGHITEAAASVADSMQHHAGTNAPDEEAALRYSVVGITGPCGRCCCGRFTGDAGVSVLRALRGVADLTGDAGPYGCCRPFCNPSCSGFAWLGSNLGPPNA